MSVKKSCPRKCAFSGQYVIIYYLSSRFLVTTNGTAKACSSQHAPRLFRCVRISIRGLARRTVRWLVRPSVGNAFVEIDEKWTFTDSKRFRQCWTRKKEGLGGKSDEEERGTRRKERLGE